MSSACSRRLRKRSGCRRETGERGGQAGFTLVELIVAIGIAGGLMGFVAARLGGSPLNLMRQESTKLIRTVKYAYFQAATLSQYYRVVFDLDNQTYLVEQSANVVQVIREGDLQEELRKRNEDKDKPIESIAEESVPPPPPSGFAESEDEVLDIATLPKKIKILDVFVAHQNEKIEQGKAYLYFFPRGQSEFAVIHLSDTEKEEEFMTLIVNPLTGSVEVKNEYVEHEDVLSEMERR